MRIYSPFIKKDSLVFDIGANLGSRTEIFLKLGARVVAVEPRKYCMRRLEKRYGDNEKVILLKIAISDRQKEEETIISDTLTLSSISKEWRDSFRGPKLSVGKNMPWLKSLR